MRKGTCDEALADAARSSDQHIELVSDPGKCGEHRDQLWIDAAWRTCIEILKRCDGKAEVSAIVDDLARAFAAEPAQVAGDVRGFLQDLVDKGMVTL